MPFGPKAATHFASFFSTGAGAGATRAQAYQQLGLVGRSVQPNTGGHGSSRFYSWPDRANSTASGETGSDDDAQRRFGGRTTRSGLRRSSSVSRVTPSTPKLPTSPALGKVALAVRYRSAATKISHAFAKVPSPSPAGPTRPRRHSTSSLDHTPDAAAALPIYMVRRPSQQSIRPPPTAQQVELKQRFDEIVARGSYDELQLLVNDYLQSGQTSATLHNVAIASLDALRPEAADPQPLLAVYQSYSAHNIRPSVNALSKVISTLCRYDAVVRNTTQDDVPYVKALGLYDLRKSLVNTELPTIVLDGLVKAAAERGDVEAATSVFQAMFEPTAQTYRSLLTLHRVRGHVEDARLTMSMLATAQTSRSLLGLEEKAIGDIGGSHTVAQDCWAQYIRTLVASDPAAAISTYQYLEGSVEDADLPPRVPINAEILGQLVLGFIALGDVSSAANWLERINTQSELASFAPSIATIAAQQIAAASVDHPDRLAALERIAHLEGVDPSVGAALEELRLMGEVKAMRALTESGQLDAAATSLEVAVAKLDHARRTGHEERRWTRFGEAIEEELERALALSSESFPNALKIAQAAARAGFRPTGLAAFALASAYLVAVAEETADLSPQQWASIVDAFAVAKPTFLGPIVERAAQNGVAQALDSIMAGWTAQTLPQVVQQPDEVDRLTGLLSGLSPSGSSATLSLTPPSPATPFPESPPTLLTPVSSEYGRSTYQHDPTLDKEIAMVHAPHASSLLLRIARASDRGLSADPYALVELIRKLSQADASIERIYQAYLLGYNALELSDYAGEAQTAAWLELENEMLKAMANAHQLDKVAMHRDRILEAGYAPSADAIGSMIVHARDTTDDASVALEIFADARQMGIVPNTFLYNTVISRLSRARRSADALALFEEMKAAGLQPTSVTYGAIINATGDEATACALFEEMVVAPGYRPNVPPFNTLMQLFQGRGDRQRALQYFDRMVRARVKPTDHTWRLLLDIYGSIQPVDAKSALDVFERIRRDPDVPLSGLHWASLISMYGIALHDVDRAISVFESIARDPSSRRADPPLPDAVSYEALFNSLASAGRHDQIAHYRQRMRQDNVPLTAYIANTLIESCAARGAIEEARELFESLQDPPAGVAAPTHRQVKANKRRGNNAASRPDCAYREPSTYEALIKCELSIGDRSRAQALVDRACARAFPVAVLSHLRSLL